MCIIVRIKQQNIQEWGYTGNRSSAEQNIVKMQVKNCEKIRETLYYKHILGKYRKHRKPIIILRSRTWFVRFFM